MRTGKVRSYIQTRKRWGTATFTRIPTDPRIGPSSGVLHLRDRMGGRVGYFDFQANDPFKVTNISGDPALDIGRVCSMKMV